jgi:drug/metabolite transporter (DMT)-like permease
MLPKPSAHLAAVLQALLVTFLWSTSWVLIKVGLADIPALTFAGLRYGLATFCLLPFALRADRLIRLRHLSRRQWAGVIVLGLLYYTATQGAQFLGLAYLPAVAVSLMLSLTAIVIPLFGVLMLGEHPTRWQWIGIAVNLAGVAVYFYPVTFSAGQALGVLIMCGGVLANSLSAILGRRFNRDQLLDPLTLTTASMGLGSLALLVTGLLAQGLPTLTPSNWAIIGVLAVVNTAFAFTLWNHTLRTLSAAESGLINNTMLIQIALLAWIFLGEALTIKEIIGLVLAGLGVLLVQLRPQTLRTIAVTDS